MVQRHWLCCAFDKLDPDHQYQYLNLDGIELDADSYGRSVIRPVWW